MTYRATPVTQRDNSTHQFSNCRMASISTGLDFDTLGKKKSTGGKMRSFTADQSGGTDSGDAKEAWAKGYGEQLLVRDGQPWTRVISDLKEGRLVNLDVWHATLGEVCVSGSGRYGHNIAVAPEQNTAGEWLVSDPWCKPANWAWVSERKLRIAAEDWGSRVFNRATAGRPLPLPELGTVELGLILAAMARYLMGIYFPGAEAGPEELPSTDTGGPPPVLYTVTAAHPDEEQPMTIQFDILEDYAGHVKVKAEGPDHSALDLTTGKLIAIPDNQVRPAYAKIKVAKGTVLGDTDARRIGYLIGTSAAMLLEVDVTLQPDQPAGEYVPVGDLYVKKVT